MATNTSGDLDPILVREYTEAFARLKDGCAVIKETNRNIIRILVGTEATRGIDSELADQSGRRFTFEVMGTFVGSGGAIVVVGLTMCGVVLALPLAVAITAGLIASGEAIKTGARYYEQKKVREVHDIVNDMIGFRKGLAAKLNENEQQFFIASEALGHALERFQVVVNSSSAFGIRSAAAANILVAPAAVGLLGAVRAPVAGVLEAGAVAGTQFMKCCAAGFTLLGAGIILFDLYTLIKGRKNDEVQGIIRKLVRELEWEIDGIVSAENTLNEHYVNVLSQINEVHGNRVQQLQQLRNELAMLEGHELSHDNGDATVSVAPGRRIFTIEALNKFREENPGSSLEDFQNFLAANPNSI